MSSSFSVRFVVAAVLLFLPWAGCASSHECRTPQALTTSSLGVVTATAKPTAKSRLAFRGAPIATKPDAQYILLKNKGFDIGYSDARKDPLWAAYTFTNDADQFDVKRPKSQRFKADDRCNSGVTHNDYNNTGYDRGHMAPSDALGRWYGNEAQLATFIVTNICPQKHDNNAGDWVGLETAITDVYAEDFEQVWVICGPIFDAHPKTIKNDIEVPVSFYKIVVEDDEEGDPQVLAVIMKQEIKGAHDLSDYVVTVREIEGLTHLNFFPELPQTVQDRIETTKADAATWKTDMRLQAASIRQ